MKPFLLWGGLSGLVVCTVLFVIRTQAAFEWLQSAASDKITLMLWPSAIVMLATADYAFPDLRYVTFLTIAVLGNVLLYGVVGLGLWLSLNKNKFFALPLLAMVSFIWYSVIVLR